MKFTRILGVVVFLHVLVISLVLQPGCQTKKPQPAPAAAPEPVVATPDPTLAPDFNPVPLGGTPAGSTVAAPSGTRAAPTRPTVQMAPGGGTITPDPVAGLAPAPSASRSHVVARGDSLWAIARKHGVKVDEILEANAMTRSSTIQPGQTLIIPGGDTAAAPSASMGAPVAAPAPAAAPVTEGTRYTVKSGDTLSRIASRNGTTVAALRAANNLRSDTIRLGQELLIPGASGSAPALAADTAIATRAASVPDAAPSGVTHTVAPGEAPAVIARRYGVTVEALMRANNITDARRLRVNQVLVIPGGGRAGGAPTPVQPAVAASPAPAPATSQGSVPFAAPAPAAVTPAQLEQIPLDDDVPLIPVDGPPPPPRR